MLMNTGRKTLVYAVAVLYFKMMLDTALLSCCGDNKVFPVKLLRFGQPLIELFETIVSILS
jgi:hypothetical protein